MSDLAGSRTLGPTWSWFTHRWSSVLLSVLVHFPLEWNPRAQKSLRNLCLTGLQADFCRFRSEVNWTWVKTACFGGDFPLSTNEPCELLGQIQRNHVCFDLSQIILVSINPKHRDFHIFDQRWGTMPSSLCTVTCLLTTCSDYSLRSVLFPC